MAKLKLTGRSKSDGFQSRSTNFKWSPEQTKQLALSILKPENQYWLKTSQLELSSLVEKLVLELHIPAEKIRAKYTNERSACKRRLAKGVDKVFTQEQILEKIENEEDVNVLDIFDSAFVSWLEFQDQNPTHKYNPRKRARESTFAKDETSDNDNIPPQFNSPMTKRPVRKAALIRRQDTGSYFEGSDSGYDDNVSVSEANDEDNEWYDEDDDEKTIVFEDSVFAKVGNETKKKTTTSTKLQIPSNSNQNIYRRKKRSKNNNIRNNNNNHQQQQQFSSHNQYQHHRHSNQPLLITHQPKRVFIEVGANRILMNVEPLKMNGVNELIRQTLKVSNIHLENWQKTELFMKEPYAKVSCLETLREDDVLEIVFDEAMYADGEAKYPIKIFSKGRFIFTIDQVDSSRTVGEIKRKISKELGKPELLVHFSKYDDIPMNLSSSKTLAEAGIVGKDVILRVLEVPSFPITVIDPQMETMEVMIDELTTVAELKGYVHEKCDIPVESLFVSLDGTQLKGGATLLSCGAKKDGSTILEVLEQIAITINFTNRHTNMAMRVTKFAKIMDIKQTLCNQFDDFAPPERQQFSFNGTVLDNKDDIELGKLGIQENTVIDVIELTDKPVYEETKQVETKEVEKKKEDNKHNTEEEEKMDTDTINNTNTMVPKEDDKPLKCPYDKK